MEIEIQDFVRFCAVERRLAPLTCSAYERDVRACERFLAAEACSGWDAVRVPDLRRFLADEAVRRPAPSSQSRTVAALRCFFRFLVESEYIERDRRSGDNRTTSRRAALARLGPPRSGC